MNRWSKSTIGGERLTGCPPCNRWQAAPGEWCRLAPDDIMALPTQNRTRSARMTASFPGGKGRRINNVYRRLPKSCVCEEPNLWTRKKNPPTTLEKQGGCGGEGVCLATISHCPTLSIFRG